MSSPPPPPSPGPAPLAGPAGIDEIAQRHGIVGRRAELRGLLACVRAGRHALLEGPVGVGKTALARAVAHGAGLGFVRVDGDGRYTEARLVGHFDPPGVLARGYLPELFVPGPLLLALQGGHVLFLNELNRMPEGVQNVLLPALDEGMVLVPHLGEVRAAPGFRVVATQNPAEFVAAGQLSEALLDRFELVRLGHQPEDEEVEIVRGSARGAPSDALARAAVALVRETRADPRVRRGASVRAAIAIAELAVELDGDLRAAAALALPTRIELAEGREAPIEQLVDELERRAAAKAGAEKKSPSTPPPSLGR
jgi:MoxR-like ATPase